MSREVKDGWDHTIFKADSLPCPVKELIPEVVTAELCSIGSHKTLPPYGNFPPPPSLPALGKP